MTDLFESKNIQPMLIGQMMEPFNDKNWIYELKLDGCRCIAYLNSDQTELRNKRNMQLLSKFPELKGLHTNVKDSCILDGELLVLKNGVPDFYELQRRTLLTDAFKIKIAANQLPATFVAYDCLYMKRESILEKPLSQRKEWLQQLVLVENLRFAISRYIHENGIELYNIADERKLEGVVAKRWDSFYYQGKRSKDWIKFKRMSDEDFVVTGYIQKEENIFSLILGRYKNGRLIYKGHVTSGVTKDTIQLFKVIQENPFHMIPAGNENAVWIQEKVCTVEYMPNTKNSLRQPVFKGIREEILPIECIEKES